ncbi:MAG: UDP-N-acetylenolpyruvoylglucosamine reductase [Verrucomicrobiales bacterium]|nr:UDP-N-acetylenolpyruvoylglucosamine reductase [Verrucomicrobiales bacterium]|tara:strand:+ start:5589 stop:8000 length:2412 start_codon:yes stop_codon:yes gene_type:complete
MNRLNADGINEILDGSRRETVYLVGAGGCGMSALGHLLLDLGFLVAGSDLETNDDVRRLQARGAVIHEDHRAEQIEWAHPVMVVYSSAILMENVELAAARMKEIPIIKRASLLAALMNRQQGVCVAGMHGKTTTAALLAYALKELELEPSYAIGGGVPQLGRSASFSQHEWVNLVHHGSEGESGLRHDDTFFVVEADESDGTLDMFEPRHGIILNIDEEHLEYFECFDEITREFGKFANQIEGKLLYCADDPDLVELLAGRKDVISYGFNPLANYRIEITDQSTASPGFEVFHNDDSLGEFRTQLLGATNASNAGAVVAFLAENHFSGPEISKAISRFSGAKRRQQLLFRSLDHQLYEDYAHHPLEISATIAAFRELKPGRLLVAFQPHRFTRTRHLLEDFAGCFKGADKLWITEVYAASEEAIPGVNGELLATAVKARGQDINFASDLNVLREMVRNEMRPGDTVLFLGAGDITSAAAELAHQLQTEMRLSKNQQVLDELGTRLSGDSVIRANEALAKKTTMRVGGPAEIYVEPASEADLSELIRFCNEQELPITALGRGSNLVIRDGGVRGVVLSFAHESFSGVRAEGLRLHCGAGVRLKMVAVEARNAEISGLEFLEGIPGSIGGALRMNAGAMGSEMFDCVERMRFVDREGNIHEVTPSEIEVQYRSCPMLKDAIAIGAVLRGESASREEIEARMKKFSQKRWDTQPAQSSAGCMFKNPSEIAAGKLIDELGLKGTRVGGATVSDVHGNFMVNAGKATARDVLELIEMVKGRVKEARGIDLHTEVQVIGEDNMVPSHEE